MTKDTISQAELESQDIYRLLFETAGEGLLVVDKSGTIKMMNPRVKEMFGYSKKELIGQCIEVLVPESLRSRHKSHRVSYNKNPKKRSMGANLDLAARRKDGSTFPVEISLNYFKRDGEMLVMALITDITQRKKADLELKKLNEELEKRVEERTEALQESQELYKAIARNFPNGTISVFDEDLKYVFIEGKELYKLGVTSEKLIGSKLTDRIPTELAENIEVHLQNVFDGINATFEFEHREQHYILIAVPLPDLKGKVNRILVVEQNITQRKKAEEETRKSLEKEKELSELKSRFVSMASHEFRTPLSTILSSVSLLQRYDQPEHEEKRNKHIKRIKSSVNNLTGILNDFLSLDKLEEGKVENKPVEFDVEKFAKDITEEMQAVAKQKQEIRYSHKGKTKVQLDKQILKNILFNLLSNASKYSGEGQEIDFNTRLENNHLEIEITDHGIGIPEEEQEHIFSRFFRADNATNIQGTGLGLNIVKKYVDLMNGKIGFTSKKNTGTTFTINLPIK